MEEYEQSVFISYAWGGESELIVNQIDQTLQHRGLKIIRDKRDLGYKGSISTFMERIGQGNCVILVISDKYLRSPNCMFELVEIAEGKQFHDRVFPIVLSDANIYDPVKRLEYVKHWEMKRGELAQAMKDVDPANLQGIREDMDLYDRIRDKVSGLTSILKDMNTLTPDLHRDSDFSEIYASIEKRMAKASAQFKPEMGKPPYMDLRSIDKTDAALFPNHDVITQEMYPGIQFYFDRYFPRLHWHLTRIGILPIPPGWTEINNYLRDLRSHIKNEVREKTYLPLAGKPLPSISPIAQEAAKDPFILPIHQVILQILGKSYGGDSASAQIAASSRQSRVVRNILKHLDSVPDPLILLGEPGSGKTMTLQQAAMLLAEREIHRIYPRIPIYVRLGEFYVDGKVDEKDVWEYVQRSVPSTIRHQINELERNGRLVIFFDGMDEMSRHRYGEHTEALSMFADYTYSKTLFSCRITDFSPRFLHQRLVILPFDRGQVAEYLNKYIEHFPIVVDKRAWTVKELSKYIVKGELPIEANNPFVLWLLCLYLQEKKSWPVSRVEMLRFYNERNYERKNAERQANELPFPKMESAFHEWARFAYLTSERNRGPAIPVSLLQLDQNSATVQEMIRVGKRCGILAESHDKYDEHLIRYEHHRFQEFFAALHIHENRPQINWLDRLDAPRWQETMINLILMGEAEDAISTFASSVLALTQTCQFEIAEIQRIRDEYKLKKEIDTLRKSFNSISEAELEERIQDFREQFSAIPEHKLEDSLKNIHKEYVHYKEQGVKRSDDSERRESSRQDDNQANLKEPELALSDENEAVLADRVEVASRIMHQVRTDTTNVRVTLMPPFREAVSVLAEYGNPITQVKVMQACQNVPEIDFIEALRKPLNSSVNWVRNQALLLIAGSQIGARVIGSDIATEICYDLANGRFPERLVAYWKAAVMTRDRGHWWSLFVGSFCYLTYVFLLLAAAAILYLGMRSLGDATWLGLPNFSSLSYPISMFTFGFVLILATAFALKSEPSSLWLAILASAITLIILIPILFALWAGSWSEFGAFLGALLLFGWVAIWGASMLIAIPLHFTVLAIYLAATSRIRQHGHTLITFVKAAWKGSSFDGTVLLGFGAFTLFWILGWWIDYLQQQSINPWIDRLLDGLGAPTHPLATALIVLFAFYIFVVLPALAIISVVVGAGNLVRRIGWVRSMGMVLIACLVVACSLLLMHFLNNWRAEVFAIGALILIGILAELRVFLGKKWEPIHARSVIGQLIIFSIGLVILYLLGRMLWPLLVRYSDLIAKGAYVVLAIAILVPLIDVLYNQWRKGHKLRATGLLLLVCLAIWVTWAWAEGFLRWAQVGSLIARILSAIILILLITPFFVALHPWDSIWYLAFFSARRFPPGSFTPEHWKNNIEKSNADRQESLLLRTDHQSLSLTASQYLDVLKEIRFMIKQEPALSTYWEQRNRLEEALKQEREG